MDIGIIRFGTVTIGIELMETDVHRIVLLRIIGDVDTFGVFIAILYVETNLSFLVKNHAMMGIKIGETDVQVIVNKNMGGAVLMIPIRDQHVQEIKNLLIVGTGM